MLGIDKNPFQLPLPSHASVLPRCRRLPDGEPLAGPALHRQAPVLLHDLAQRPHSQRLQSCRVPRREDRCLSHPRKFLTRVCFPDFLTRHLFLRARPCYVCRRPSSSSSRTWWGACTLSTPSAKGIFPPGLAQLMRLHFGGLLFCDFPMAEFFWTCILRVRKCKRSVFGGGGRD